MLLVAFVRNEKRDGYDILVLSGSRHSAVEALVELHQPGRFTPIDAEDCGGRLVTVRTPPAYLMRGWVA